MERMDIPQYHYWCFFDDRSGEYVARCCQIPGLSGVGPTMREAHAELKVAVAGWLAVLREKGIPAPEPE